MKVTIEKTENGFVIKNENGKTWVCIGFHYLLKPLREAFKEDKKPTPIVRALESK